MCRRVVKCLQCVLETNSLQKCILKVVLKGKVGHYSQKQYSVMGDCRRDLVFRNSFQGARLRNSRRCQLELGSRTFFSQQPSGEKDEDFFAVVSSG